MTLNQAISIPSNIFNEYSDPSEDEFFDVFSSTSESDVVIDQSSVDQYSENDSNDVNIESQSESELSVSKDKIYKWSSIQPRQNVREQSLNIIRFKSGISQRITDRVYSPFSALKTFITDDIISKILESTNDFLQSRNKPNITIKDICLWIACNYYLGFMKSKNTSLQEAWNVTKGLLFLSKSNIIF